MHLDGYTSWVSGLRSGVERVFRAWSSFTASRAVGDARKDDAASKVRPRRAFPLPEERYCKSALFSKETFSLYCYFSYYAIDFRRTSFP